MSKKHKTAEQDAALSPEEEQMKDAPAADVDELLEQVCDVPELSETEKLRKEVDELKAKLLYLTADYQNYRKRSAKDISDARVLGTIHTLEAFLRTFDFLAMARDAAEQSDNIEAIRQGVIMILGEYEKALDELGITRFSAMGKPFDPTLHDAAAREPSDVVPEGVVLKEWFAGYKMGERLIRPAKVIVSAGPAIADDEEKN